MICARDGGVIAAFESGALTRLGKGGVTSRVIIPEGDVASLLETGQRDLVVAYRSGRIVAVAWT